MKKNFISTLSAIALAVPLGIGVMILAPLATATDADAQDVLTHHFETCSNSVIWRCLSRIRPEVFSRGDQFGYVSRALPHGSNGADGQAWDYLRNRLDSGTLGFLAQENWQRAFDIIFPDGVRPPDTVLLTPQEAQLLATDLRNQRFFGIQPDPDRDNTIEANLELFREACERSGGRNTERYSFLGSLDWGRFQCRITEQGSGLLGIRFRDVSFDPGEEYAGVQLQVTPLGRFGTPGNENPFTDGDERTVISDHRDRIVELQEEVTQHEEAIAAMLDAQNTNSGNIRTNTRNIAALNSRVETFADDIQKNTAGIALAYAFPSSGLNYNESFRLSGGAGYFREEAAVAFGFTGRLSANVTASGGVGLADGVSGARVEI